MPHYLSRIGFAAAALAALPAFALDIQLPPETAVFRPSALPGYALAQRDCMTCHSVHYIQTQPPSLPRAYWEATVKKMKRPFGAQFPDQDMPALVDYLVKTYGAERSATSAAPAALLQPVAARGAADGAALVAAHNCATCHAVDDLVYGPSFKDVAAKYKGKDDAVAQVARTIRAGSVNKWGPDPMPPNAGVSEADASALARYVLSQ